MSVSPSSMSGAGEAGVRTVVWFRRDLRVEDNPALAAAARTAGEVVPVYVWAPEEDGPYYPGRVSRWWLSQSLKHLDASLRRLGASRLVTRRSADAVAALIELVHSIGATHLFFNHLYDPLSLVRDHRVKELLTAEGITVQSFNADLLYEPWEVVDDDGCPFTMFAPFWNRCLCMPDPAAPLLPPKRISPGELWRRCPSDELVFEDESERGSNALLARAWSPGWQNGDKALAAFLNGPLMDYSVNRKKADSASTSLLSPYLHFGELSVRKVFHQVRMKQLMWSNEGNHAGDESCVLFLRSIGLREYSRYLTFNHPCSLEKPLLAHLRFFPWVVDEVYFKVWRQGRTGYPLVDAGMRELWATGWLHDRIRVVVSSFFVKVLQLPWRWGMKYFWDTLLDADLESDALGWQYISGSLPDGRELDRIDNPQLEGYKFDPHGEYVRRWLPELARLPTEWIHHPWDAPESVLQAAGIELGSNYPLPIVELDAAKTRLQDALSEMWELEAASRAAMENGMEEGLGDSSDVPPIAFPPELQMEVDQAPAQPHPTTAHGLTTAGRRRQDQMVPSMTSSLVRAETELSADFDNNSMDSRQEVPSQVHFQPRIEREETVDGGGMVARSNGGGHQGHQQHNLQNTIHRARGNVPSTSEASSSWTGRGGGVVPVWSPPAASGPSDHYAADEADITSRSYLDRHPQSHTLMNWSQLSQSL
uniref:Photolyase/cryptochrome alpha/beta domain-containing protein n=1 Tax=Leersia perrieri TaxID=77586 RepID=A0A0D9VHE1_9ORYZ